MRISNRLRFGAGLSLLAGVLAASLWMPIPSTPDAARASVASQVRERLPGWRIERVEASWEGAHTVVTTCAERRLGFQFVPGHGLPPEDAWLRPSDAYARDLLADVSDHWRHLIWYSEPALHNRHSCSEELARTRPLDPLRGID